MISQHRKFDGKTYFLGTRGNTRAEVENARREAKGKFHMRVIRLRDGFATYFRRI